MADSHRFGLFSVVGLVVRYSTAASKRLFYQDIPCYTPKGLCSSGGAVYWEMFEEAFVRNALPGTFMIPDVGI